MRVLSPQKLFFLKVTALLSIIRWYVIGLVALAQLIVSIFVINPRSEWKAALLDINFWIIIICTALTIAAGFAINNFYDSERDLINRPQRTLFERLVSKQIYFSILLWYKCTCFCFVACLFHGKPSSFTWFMQQDFGTTVIKLKKQLSSATLRQPYFL